MVVVVILAILGGIVVLGGAHTLEGFGNDLQKSGERIDKMSGHSDRH